MTALVSILRWGKSSRFVITLVDCFMRKAEVHVCYRVNFLGFLLPSIPLGVRGRGQPLAGFGICSVLVCNSSGALGSIVVL